MRSTLWSDIYEVNCEERLEAQRKEIYLKSTNSSLSCNSLWWFHGAGGVKGSFNWFKLTSLEDFYLLKKKILPEKETVNQLQHHVSQRRTFSNNAKLLAASELVRVLPIIILSISLHEFYEAYSER